MTTTPRHVIFGTGAIGLALLDALRRRGETARLINRSGSARVPDDVEVLAGDGAADQRRERAVDAAGDPRSCQPGERKGEEPGSPDQPVAQV